MIIPTDVYRTSAGEFRLSREFVAAFLVVHEPRLWMMGRRVPVFSTWQGRLLRAIAADPRLMWC